MLPGTYLRTHGITQKKMEPGAQFQTGRERGGYVGGALHTGS